MLQVPLVPAMAPGQHMMDSGGFEIWEPSAPPPESDFQISGSEFSQVLELTVCPGEVITAEPQTMLFMTPGLEMDADVGGFDQGLTRALCAGESFFRLKLRNNSHSDQRLALTPKFPAKVVPIDLRQYSGMAMSKGAFLSAKGEGWNIRLERVRSVGALCCAGQGLFLNRLHGDGMVFLSAGGTVMVKQLARGEEVIIDKHSLLAMEKTVTLGIRRTGGAMVCCCAGQGLFNAVLTGPGWVMLQSMALGKLQQAVAPPMPSSSGDGSSGSKDT